MVYGFITFLHQQLSGAGKEASTPVHCQSPQEDVYHKPI